MGVSPPHKVRKAGSNGMSAARWSILRLSTTPIRFRPFVWEHLDRQMRENVAAILVRTTPGVTQASSDQDLRLEILTIGRSLMDRYDQARKQLAE